MTSDISSLFNPLVARNQHFIETARSSSAALFDIQQGESGRILRHIPASMIDAVICDPPYMLRKTTPNEIQRIIAAAVAGSEVSFEGKRGVTGAAWDGGLPQVSFWREVYRVMKPGASLVAFCGSRNAYLMGTLIALAGFVSQDSLAWIHNSGVQKNIDIAIELDAFLLERKREKRTKEDGLYVPQTGLGTIYSDYRYNLRSGYDAILMFRKPMSEPNVHRNISVHGCGGLNIRETRIPNEDGSEPGKYPPNVIGDGLGQLSERYFFCPKVGKDERGAGLAGTGLKNDHPCLKPVDLMRWLTKLVCPPNGIVLDPFCGSGSGGIGALLEDRHYIGIEMDSVYAKLAQRRIAHWTTSDAGRWAA